jgi:hypothetical protein
MPMLVNIIRKRWAPRGLWLLFRITEHVSKILTADLLLLDDRS